MLPPHHCRRHLHPRPGEAPPSPRRRPPPPAGSPWLSTHPRWLSASTAPPPPWPGVPPRHPQSPWGGWKLGWWTGRMPREGPPPPHPPGRAEGTWTPGWQQSGLLPKPPADTIDPSTSGEGGGGSGGRGRGRGRAPKPAAPAAPLPGGAQGAPPGGAGRVGRRRVRPRRRRQPEAAPRGLPCGRGRRRVWTPAGAPQSPGRGWRLQQHQKGGDMCTHGWPWPGPTPRVRYGAHEVAEGGEVRGRRGP